MNKLLSYILPIFVIIPASLPPIEIHILPPPFKQWPWMMAIMAFLGMRIIFIKTDIFVKTVAVSTFLLSFFSIAPYMSFNQYPMIVSCCYFYIGLTRMESWKPMMATLKTLLIVNCIFLFIQFIGNDTLFNFGLDIITTYGVVGHHMQMASFSVILAACLSLINPFFFLFPVVVGFITKSTWALICAGVGLLIQNRSEKLRMVALVVIVAAVVMCVKTGKIEQALSDHSGRLVVWKKSVQLLNKKPIEGYGPGSYKYIFQPLAEMSSYQWRTAHNDWIQFAFELGYILFLVIVGGWIWVVSRLIYSGRSDYLAGFIVISVNMLVHFPTRMIQCVPMIICFLAYFDSSLAPRKLLNNKK